MDKKIRHIYFLSFLFTLHIALSAYINSTFLTNIISENSVGLLYTGSSLLTLILLAKSSSILKYMGNRKLTIFFLFVNMISLLGLVTSTIPLVIATSFVIFMTTNTLVLFCIDIFIEHFSDQEKTGETRGLYLTIVNIGYMVSPLIAAFLITKGGGYKAIYMLAFILMVIMTIFLIFSVKTFQDKIYIKQPFLQTYKYLLCKKNMLSIVIVNFLLQFFFAWMVIYTPIYLYNHIGFNWDQIGIIFTIMLIPFVILGLPIGLIIDKYKVSKVKLLNIGFIIIIIFTSLIAFIYTKNIIVWGVILFMTRIGASIIETTSEIYFFENITDKDTHLLSVYRDMYPVAYIIAPLLATVILFFVPFNNYLFLILGFIMLSGFYYIPKIKNEYLSCEN